MSTRCVGGRSFEAVPHCGTLPGRRRAYTPIYGRRYLFGDLERKSLSLEVRANYTFTPKLSFQLCAQPLISSGDYVRYKQLAAPSTFSFRNFQGRTAANVRGNILCASGDI